MTQTFESVLVYYTVN